MFLEMSSLTFPCTIISNNKFPIIKNFQFSIHPKKKQLLHDQKYVSSFIHLNQVSSKRNCLLYPLKCNARDNSENNPEEGEFNAKDNSENNPEEGGFNAKDNSENNPEEGGFNAKDNSENNPEGEFNAKDNSENNPEEGEFNVRDNSENNREEGRFNVEDNSKNNSEEGQKAMETVQKLYNALKNKNLSELSDTIGEECRCISNVASSLQTFYGKEQVMDFFNSILKLLGHDNFEFVIRPTIHDGTDVGVAWTLTCDDFHIPIVKGFGFYCCHYYKGHMMIRNVEMFIEPLLQLEPLRLKILSFLLRAIQKVTPDFLMGKKKQAMNILFKILLFVALLYLIKKFM